MTADQLQRRFDEYRERYWPGRMRQYRVVAGPTRTIGALGECVYAEKLLIVDVSNHATLYDLRTTLLHEMAHAAAGSCSRGRHDSLFFAQLEFLLERGARLKMGLPETGNLPNLDSVPDRFPLARKALTRAYLQAQRQLVQADIPEFTVDNEYLCSQFEDAGRSGATWLEALRAIGRAYGLVDIDDKIQPSMKPFLSLYREAYRTGQSDRRQFARAKAVRYRGSP